MNKKFGKVIKTTLTVIGAAAIAKVVSDKFSKIHNKKLCDCINEKFNNGKNIVIKSFIEEECIHCGDDNLKYAAKKNVLKNQENHIITPDIKKYEFPNNEEHTSNYSITINSSSHNCCEDNKNDFIYQEITNDKEDNVI